MTEQDKGREGEFKELSFEQALARLEEIVQAMETGGLKLEEYIQLFEDGLKLARHCSGMLSDTELRISRIRTAYGDQGQIAETQDVEGHEDC